jgi:hypothetical protein
MWPLAMLLESSLVVRSETILRKSFETFFGMKGTFSRVKNVRNFVRPDSRRPKLWISLLDDFVKQLRGSPYLAISYHWISNDLSVKARIGTIGCKSSAEGGFFSLRRTRTWKTPLALAPPFLTSKDTLGVSARCSKIPGLSLQPHISRPTAGV